MKKCDKTIAERVLVVILFSFAGLILGCMIAASVFENAEEGAGNRGLVLYSFLGLLSGVGVGYIYQLIGKTLKS